MLSLEVKRKEANLCSAGSTWFLNSDSVIHDGEKKRSVCLMKSEDGSPGYKELLEICEHRDSDKLLESETCTCPSGSSSVHVSFFRSVSPVLGLVFSLRCLLAFPPSCVSPVSNYLPLPCVLNPSVPLLQGQIVLSAQWAVNVYSFFLITLFCFSTSELGCL